MLLPVTAFILYSLFFNRSCSHETSGVNTLNKRKNYLKNTGKYICRIKDTGWPARVIYDDELLNFNKGAQRLLKFKMYIHSTGHIQSVHLCGQESSLCASQFQSRASPRANPGHLFHDESRGPVL